MAINIKFFYGNCINEKHLGYFQQPLVDFVTNNNGLCIEKFLLRYQVGNKPRG